MQDVERNNYHHLVMEVSWYGLALAATSRFLSVFAIRLGATPSEIGWITALPFIVLLFSTALSTRWRSRYQDSIKAITLPSFGFRFVFLFPALAVFFPPALQPAWLIISAALAALPQGISNTLFVSMLREAVPEERMTKLISQRTVGMNITLAIAALSFGLWLEVVPFPINYQLMFVAAFVLGIVSHFHLLRIKVKPMPVIQQSNTPSNAKPLQSRTFQKVLFVGVAIHIGFMAALPVTPLHLVDSLGASEGFMAIFGVAEIAAAACIALFTGRIVNRIGHRRMVGLAMMGTAASTFILATATTLPITLLAGIFSGASWTAATIGLFGLFTESTHEVATTDMTRYATVYHQFLFVAAFIGPLIGSTLANNGMALTHVMMLGFIMRIVASLSVINVDTIWSLLPQRPQPLNRWAIRHR